MSATDAPAIPAAPAAADESAVALRADRTVPPTPTPAYAALASFSPWVARERERAARSGGLPTKAGEWLLDNAYLVRRAIRLVSNDLPAGFYARLPSLVDGTATGTPRIDAVARAFLSACELQGSSEDLARHLREVQTTTPLDLSELWALPSFLRLAFLETFVEAIAEATGILSPLARYAGSTSTPLPCRGAAAERVARAIGGLRMVSAVAWAEFVPEVSALEAALAKDPAGAYALMDSVTRDRYRTVVAELARASDRREVETAYAAIELAARSLAADDARRGHVGYWLIDAGRVELERVVGVRPPLPERLRRAVLARPGLAYGIGVVLATVAALSVPLLYLRSVGASTGLAVVAIALACPAAIAVGVGIANFVVAWRLPPRVLAKLEWKGGIPEDAATAVIVPALLGSVREAERLVRRLEVHYLSNPDRRLHFALLTDLVDAPVFSQTGEREILDAARAGVRALNERHGEPGRRPFHWLHRDRCWNESEQCFMGWERKRGKLEEFDRLVASEPRSADATGSAGVHSAGFTQIEGDVDALKRTRYVLTLDADTRLPRGAAARLVGTMAHPLNQAVVTDAGRVVAGCSVIQPRVEITPESARRSRFARLTSGDGAIDIYTRAVSDAYQDLFGVGIYVGKGLYDPRAFRKTLEGRIPENAIASHDLIEGAHGRVALATDVVLFEEYPSHVLAFTRRLHRWIRGDWQLLPWLFRRVPTARGERADNPLPALERWKIADNLRRSLLAPTLLALLVAGWLVLPGSPIAWTVFAALAPAVPLLGRAATELARGALRTKLSVRARATVLAVKDGFGRLFVLLTILPHEARVALDAIVRAIHRMRARRRLLQWTTASHTARSLSGGGAHSLLWTEMIAAPCTAVVVGAALLVLRPEALVCAAPLLVLWLASPEIARLLSLPVRPAVERTTPDEDRALRLLARRTWLFFTTTVGPVDQWLPPDNLQIEPRGETAHRTSPTNIGQMLVSTLAAWDLGHLGTPDLALRVRATLDTVARLERRRGHLLNWYDTRTLEPLLPRYVSTVDSGNLAASLWTLETGLVEAASAPAIGRQRWDGLLDTVALLRVAVERLPADDVRRAVDPALASLAELERRVREVTTTPARWSATLAALRTEIDAVVRDVSRAAARPRDAAALHAARVWTERLQQNRVALARDLERLTPWQPVLDEVRGAGALERAQDAEVFTRIAATLPPDVALSDIDRLATTARAEIAAMRTAQLGACGSRGGSSESLESTERHERLEHFDRVDAALAAGAARARETADDLLRTAARARAEADAMDFRWLYDAERRVFRIGYNVTAEKADPNHYDLLASEARIASLVAIAKGDVAPEHWHHLGRPVTSLHGRLTLLSWGGTMFEFLMPTLFVRSGSGTLLDRSERAAIAEQMRYARRRALPWGVSESGFYAFDPARCYQYRSFGVPGLGLKRGLGDERVVAPYASVLALPMRPRAVVRNLAHLEELGLLGPFGLYEAVDFTPSRVPAGRPFAIVRSYMAHHQGMILAALANHLCSDSLVRRFQASPLVRTADLLVNERAPLGAMIERPHGRADSSRLVPEESPHLSSWTPVRAAGSGAGAFPEVVALGNGRLASVTTDGGAGGLALAGDAITRFSPSSGEASGIFVYVRDEESGRLDSVSRLPTGTTPADGGVQFSDHVAEFHRRDGGITMRMEVFVAPADDVEVRRISLSNETERPRRLVVASAAEIVLGRGTDWERHPAFHRLFVWTEPRPELEGVLAGRRARRPEERPPVVLHRLVAGRRHVRFDGVETDRARLVGRHGSWRRPRGLAGPRRAQDAQGALATDPGAVATLDPVLSVRAVVDLPPRGSETLAFVTVVGTKRDEVLETARHYDSVAALEWTLADAARDSARECRRLGLEPRLVPLAHRLLSLALHPHGPLRAPPAAFASNRLGQTRLWGHGVSGDVPVVLIRLRANDDDALVRDALLAHALWRRRGQSVDLVVLREGASSYEADVDGRIERLLRETGAEGFRGHRGGVFVLRADQIPEDERLLLDAVARVRLDAAAGPLETQLANLHAPTQSLPAFAAMERPDDVRDAPVARPGDLRFDNGFGGFTPDGREYVIHLREGEATPAPWANVLANNADFGALTTEAGLGVTWAVNAAERRLTSWSNDPLLDVAGEVLYLRDEATAQVWTVTPSPAGGGGDCQVRHRPGATTFLRRDHGLEQSVEVFVAAADPVKLVRVRLKNLRARPRRVTATYFAHWVLGATTENGRQFVVPEYDPASETLLAKSAWNPDFAERTAFLVADRRPHGFTTDRVEFVGRDGDLSMPAALLRWGLSGAVEPGRDPCAALQVHLDIEAGGEAVLHFALGDGRDRADAIALSRRFRAPEAASAERERVAAMWESVLGAVEVRTPDPALDVAVNRWLPYQALAARVLARSGFYQSSGAYGFRDQLQDVLAFVHSKPAVARAHILACARHQFEQGDVLHWWHPPADLGVRTRCSDDMLWLPYAVAHYVESTGDDTVLNERVPFVRAERLRPDEHDRYARFDATGEPASLWEHCVAAIEVGSTAGVHGLPLIGDCDWNDGMNRVGARGLGESVWLGWFLVAALDAMARLADRRGDRERAAAWRERAKATTSAIETHGWDGAWYRRAYDDDGRVLGSARNTECRIDSIAQSWAVLSGRGNPERARRAILAAERALARGEELLALLWPPFHVDLAGPVGHEPASGGAVLDPGYIDAYPPGVRENGGQYNHAVVWLGLAFAATGDGDRAHAALRRVLGVLRSSDAEAARRYRVEPYVVAADVYTVPPHAGRGGWTWYTGSAAWGWRLAVEGILGLRRVGGGLVVSPTIPKAWPRFDARLRVPGGSLEIAVDNRSGAGSGVRSVRVDGVAVEPGARIDMPVDGRAHRVEVVLGTETGTRFHASESEADERGAADRARKTGAGADHAPRAR